VSHRLRASAPFLATLGPLIAVLLSVGPVRAADPVLVGAGDISDCARGHDWATAKLLGATVGTVFTAGDNVYPNGSASEFRDCYGPTWGRYLARTRPTLGDNDYGTAGASGAFGYFGARAGSPSKGYYSFDIGSWHAVMLNSNCSEIGGCGATSPQVLWLRSDLAAHPRACTIAIFHHPRFSSAQLNPDDGSLAMWQALYDYGADVIVNGHRHQYERFAQQTPAGAASSFGIREFVVGTGGAPLVGFSTIAPNSRLRDNQTYGVLKLTLHPTTYDFAFIPIAGQTFRDGGSFPCHGRPPA
jgi:acid phosphatase type 7